jgi:cytochrome c2
MKRSKQYCLAASLLLALGACQANTPQSTAPTGNESTTLAPQPGATAQPKQPAAEVAAPPVRQASPPMSAAAAKGKLLAEQCAACHYFNTMNKVGPGLGGVFGRKAGSMPDFNYGFSKYVQPGKAWHWDKAHLTAWMCDSAEAITGFTGNAAATTRMPAQRICDADEQAELIAFLKTL